MDFNCDILVIGCGLSGAVVARELAQSGKKVIICERRNHIGGNMYDFVDEHGILVHKYGPHTFHTNNKDLFDGFVKEITSPSGVSDTETDVSTTISPVVESTIFDNIHEKSDIDTISSEEPKEVRAFLRKHPRCEISFALKYFSKKEIERNILLGKIIKKGNKLHI